MNKLGKDDSSFCVTFDEKYFNPEDLLLKDFEVKPTWMSLLEAKMHHEMRKQFEQHLMYDVKGSYIVGFDEYKIQRIDPNAGNHLNNWIQNKLTNGIQRFMETN